MDNYIELASRTSADDNINYLDRVDRSTYDQTFTAFFAASKAAEKLKKEIMYGRGVSRIRSINPPVVEDFESMHANLGVMGESHEFVEADTRETVLDEGGDLLWYIAKKFKRFGITFDEAFEHNIAKLQARYPERFTTELANREATGTEIRSKGHLLPEG